MNPEAYPVIIFDLGGVLINLDEKRTADGLRALNPKQFDKHFTIEGGRKLFEDYEVSKFDSDSFRDQIREVLGSHSNQKIDAIWNAMLLDIPKERIQLLKELRKTHQLYLLSNTNEIHMAFINNYLRENHEISALDELFDEVFLSFNLRMRKPNAEIFEYVLEKYNLKADSTLFIDDSAEHISTAKHLGIQTIHLTEEVTNLFDGSRR